MRIISGEFKGRKIIAPNSLPVRPTTDMAKEALFNIINNHYYFDDIRFLDLFSGSGNISYEFASRGTTEITAVDQDFGCIEFIKKTAAAFEMEIETIKADVFKFLQKFEKKSTIIFADPPYEFEDLAFSKIAEFVFKYQLLEPNGVLVIEHSKHTKLADLPNYSYGKSYGGNSFSFFEMPEIN